MSESTITTKGQTTVPQPIRDALQVQPGTKLMWNLMPDGTIKLFFNKPLTKFDNLAPGSSGSEY